MSDDFDPAQYLKKPEESEAPFDPHEYAKPDKKQSDAFNPRGTSTLFKLLEMPVNAVQAAVGAAQDASSIGDAIDKAIPAAKAEFILDKPEGKKFEDVIKKDEVQRGIPPVFANKAADILAPGARVIADPLNFLSPPVGEAAMPLAREAMGGIREGLDLAGTAARSGGRAALDVTGPAAAKLAAPVEKKPGIVDRVITTLFGPGDEAIAAYKANPKLIDQAVGPLEIKNRIDKSVKNVRNVIASKESNVAKLASDWDDAHQIALNELRQAASKPAELHGDVLSAIDDLQHQVSEKSSRAFDLLDEAGLTIPTPRLKAALTTEINNFKGVGKVTPEGRAAVARLEEIRTNLDDLPKELSGSQAKEIIQELDSVRQANMRAGQHLDQEERIKQLFRGTIDGYLKENDQYRELMAGLADDTRVLKDASKTFGDERSLARKLKGIDGDGAAVDRDLLGKLGDKVGADFRGAVEEARGAKRILKNKDLQEQLRNALPEAAAHNAAAEDLGMAKETFERVNQKLGVDSTEALVKRLISGRGVEDAKVVADLEKLTGEKFSDLVNAERIKTAFEGGRANGSRAATMGGDIGQAVGAEAVRNFGEGAVAKVNQLGSVGRAVGSVLGGAADKYGGPMARAVIDQQINGQAGKLRAFGMKLQEGAAKYGPETEVGGFARALMFHAPSIAMELVRPDSEINTKGEMHIMDPGMLDEARRAIKANRGMSSVERAKILSKMNDEGVLELKLDRPPPKPEFGMTPAQRPEETRTLQDVLNAIKNATGGTQQQPAE
jgi:hypothetical protein